MRYTYNGYEITEGYYDDNTGYWFKDLEELQSYYDPIDLNDMLEDGQIFWTTCED